MVSFSKPESDPDSESILVRIQELLELIRQMKEPGSGQPIEAFSCSLELKMKSGIREIWDVDIRRELDD